MIVTKLDIPCVWGGTLTGFLLRSNPIQNNIFHKPTVKIIGIHGWLDNLNSLLPVAEQIIDHNPSYEIYLYDRAGHGFSSHVPKGFDYSMIQNLQDMRNVIMTLGWSKEKFCIIGHSYGAMIGMTYAAAYPKEVLCVVAIDALIRAQTRSETFWTTLGSRLDNTLQYHEQPPRTYDAALTFEKVLELTKSTRPGLTDEAAKLLIKRLVREDADGKLHFTRDESLRMSSVVPYTEHTVESAIQTMKAPILFIGAIKPQWPKPSKTISLLKERYPKFEMTLIDGPHHFHMTHVNEVVDRIEHFFDKYLQKSLIENSKL